MVPHRLLSIVCNLFLKFHRELALDLMVWQCVRFLIRVLLVSPPLNPCMLPRRRSLKVFFGFLCDSLFAHFEFKDDGYGHSPTPTFGRVMSDLHRRDTSFTTQTLFGDPSSKIWGLYLSQVEKFDKERSDSWAANTNSVLVFVRHNSSIPRGCTILTSRP